MKIYINRDREESLNMVESSSSLFSSNYAGKRYRYEVVTISHHRKVLLGASNSLSVASEMAESHAEECIDNPWASDREKFDWLQNLEIIDSETNEEVTPPELCETIDSLMQAYAM